MIYRGIYHFFQTTPGQFWEWTSWTSCNKVWQFWGSSSSGVIWDYFHTSIPGMIWNYHSNPTECDIHPPWRIKDQHRINRWFIVNCERRAPVDSRPKQNQNEGWFPAPLVELLLVMYQLYTTKSPNSDQNLCWTGWKPQKNSHIPMNRRFFSRRDLLSPARASIARRNSCVFVAMVLPDCENLRVVGKSQHQTVLDMGGFFSHLQPKKIKRNFSSSKRGIKDLQNLGAQMVAHDLWMLIPGFQ